MIMRNCKRASMLFSLFLVFVLLVGCSSVKNESNFDSESVDSTSKDSEETSNVSESPDLSEEDESSQIKTDKNSSDKKESSKENTGKSSKTSSSGKNNSKKEESKVNKTSSKSSGDTEKAHITHLFIDGELFKKFKRSTLEYDIQLSDDVKTPPEISVLQSNGSGKPQIVQAKTTNDKATVSLNGVTYTINFFKKDKSNFFNNSYYKLSKKGKLNVAYFGGSITYGTGATNANTYSYRAKTTAWLKKKFPDATINETNAAIGGTGTAYGMYRAVTDLKLESASEKPDLVFIEFAINDLYDGTDVSQAKSNLECIIRTIYKYVPDADIFIIITTDQAQMNKEFDLLKAHKEIAEAYNLPYLTVGAMIWDNMLKENNGNYPTAQIYNKYFADTVHPANAGHDKYASYITSFLDEAFSSKTKIPDGTVNSYMPSDAINNLPVLPYAANFKGQSAPAGTTVDKDGHIVSNTAGTTFKFKFKGTDLKAWIWATTDGGNLSVSVDGASPVEIQLYTDYTNHKIRDIATGLENKEHTVTVTLNRSDKGSKMEIWNFLVSGSNEKSGVTIIK